MTLKKEWLICIKTSDEFERDALELKANSFGLPLDKVIKKFADKPFGNMTEKWREFVRQIEPGDELWSFETPEKMIVNKTGAIGYAILRDGETVDTLIMVRT